jgi:hypothetical protein
VCVYVIFDKELFLTGQYWNLGQPRPGNIPIGGRDEEVYEHSTGESWTSDISRPGTWDWVDNIVSSLATIAGRRH